jgi:hypothetical protein
MRSSGPRGTAAHVGAPPHGIDGLDWRASGRRRRRRRRRHRPSSIHERSASRGSAQRATGTRRTSDHTHTQRLRRCQDPCVTPYVKPWGCRAAARRTVGREEAGIRSLCLLGPGVRASPLFFFIFFLKLFYQHIRRLPTLLLLLLLSVSLPTLHFSHIHTLPPSLPPTSPQWYIIE